MKKENIKTIGRIRSVYKTREDAPSQGKDEVSEIVIFDEYTNGLKDIETFSHLHIFYLLHKSEGFSMLVTTPWDTEEHGLFTTRSPHRPTPLGYAVVELIEREDNVLKVKGLDAIDDTPVLDIKPYISGIDAKPFANNGWFEKRKPSFTPRVYEYRTETHWEGDKCEGILTGENKRDVHIGCPPEFGGKPAYWSPEHLLVASCEICIMTTFLDLIIKKHLKISSYRSKAIGKTTFVNGRFKFKTIEVEPVITVCKDSNIEDAKKFFIKAKNKCMVSNSLNVKVTVKPEIRREL